MHKQMAKKAEFLWHSEGYLKDARKSKHKKCEAVLKKIVEDEKKHLELLKGLCKDGLC
jgi:rubrerythrin